MMRKKQPPRLDSFLDFFFRAIPFFIAGAGCLVVVMILVQTFLIFKVATLAMQGDFSNGIKPIIAQAWCGSVNCLDKGQ
jgi:hypothetical protein